MVTLNYEVWITAGYFDKSLNKEIMKYLEHIIFNSNYLKENIHDIQKVQVTEQNIDDGK